MSSSARKVGIASAIWAASIFLSRIIGLVREQVIGRVLGAGREADNYWASFVLPDFLNHLLAAGALSIVFIPIFSGYLARGERERGWEAFSAIANFALVLLALLLAAGLALARPLAGLVAPGFEAADLEELTRLTRIVLPAQVFHVLGGLLSAVLQSRDQHVLPALAPLVYSASIIAGGLLGEAAGLGAEGFAWGVLAGSALGPFGLPLFGCLRTELHWSARLWLRHPDLLRYLWMSFPIMIGFSVVLADEWIQKNQGSLLGAGVIAQMQYARTLLRVPIGVFGLAAGAASYPTISRLVATGQAAEAYALLVRAVRLLLVVVLAAQVVLTVAGPEAVYLIWGWRAQRFSAQDAEATARLLAYLGLGLGGWAAQTVLARGFYALGSTWLPTIVGTAVALALLPLYVVLRQLYGAVGLAVASSTAILSYCAALGWLLRRRYRLEARPGGAEPQPPAILGTSLRLALATAAGIFAGIALRPLFAASLELPLLLLRGGVLGLASLAVYGAAARLLGLRELDSLAGLLLRRLRPRSA
jgi:putative peptidoglycan lipid II flippase